MNALYNKLCPINFRSHKCGENGVSIGRFMQRIAMAESIGTINLPPLTPADFENLPEAKLIGISTGNPGEPTWTRENIDAAPEWIRRFFEVEDSGL